MDVVIFGGKDDGKVVELSPGTQSILFPGVVPPITTILPTSPFSENAYPEIWRIVRKHHHETNEIYHLAISPRVEKWLRKNRYV
jgi:hypothetical protein